MTKRELKLRLEQEQSRITGKVCEALSVPEELVRGRCRTKQVAEARSVVWLYLNEVDPRFKMAWIANAFDKKQSTVLYGINKARSWMEGGKKGTKKTRHKLRRKLAPHHEELRGK